MKLKTLAETEKALIVETLTKHKGNLSESAKSLGIDRAFLYGKVSRFGLKEMISYGVQSK